MTRKKIAKPAPAPARMTAEERAKKVAKVSVMPNYNAGALVEAFTSNTVGKVDAFDVAEELADQAKALRGGSMNRIEAMLLSQAHSLEVLFVSLARRGRVQENLRPYEAHMKLALRAQSQCRATLEALAAIKNPPVVFAKQANIAHGPQQVNNDTASIARASETKNAPNELLEAEEHGQRLDTGATRPAGAGHQELATVEAVHRPAHGRGQGKRKP